MEFTQERRYQQEQVTLANRLSSNHGGVTSLPHSMSPRTSWILNKTKAISQPKTTNKNTIIDDN